jgi:hypothetical protein
MVDRKQREGKELGTFKGTSPLTYFLQTAYLATS